MKLATVPIMAIFAVLVCIGMKTEKEDLGDTVRRLDAESKQHFMAGCPVGTILPWSPPPGITKAPDGWELCDGVGDHLDLVSRFLKGSTVASVQSGADRKGGSTTTKDAGAHSHSGMT